MRDRPSPNGVISAGSSKEERIKEFILKHANRDVTGDTADPLDLRLVARSADSPVARAVAAAAAMLQARYTLQVIFVGANAVEVASASAADVTLVADAVGLISNPRLLDVHEQLVVDGKAVWTGDSMRREPTKCDAFESYSGNCDATARNARQAFAQLWSHCVPLALSRFAAAPAPAVEIGTAAIAAEQSASDQESRPDLPEAQ